MNEVANSIVERENSEEYLRMNAAQRWLYSEAKSVYVLKTILTLPVPLIGAMIAMLFPAYKVWPAFYGFIAAIVDLVFFDSFVSSKKKEAARVQELFDSGVLDIQWNDFKAGEMPDRGKIKELSEKYRNANSNFDDFVNWYGPPIHRLPLFQAKNACQLVNLYWEIELRRRYTVIPTAAAVILGLAVLVSGFMMKMTLETFLMSLLLPVFPALKWLIGEIRAQKSSLDLLEKLKKHADKLWANALLPDANEAAITVETRNLQNEMFVYRYTNHPIFDFIYNRLKKTIGEIAEVSLKYRVEQALEQNRKNAESQGEN